MCICEPSKLNLNSSTKEIKKKKTRKRETNPRQVFSEELRHVFQSPLLVKWVSTITILFELVRLFSLSALNVGLALILSKLTCIIPLSIIKEGLRPGLKHTKNWRGIHHEDLREIPQNLRAS